MFGVVSGGDRQGNAGVAEAGSAVLCQCEQTCTAAALTAAGLGGGAPACESGAEPEGEYSVRAVGNTLQQHACQSMGSMSD